MIDPQVTDMVEAGVAVGSGTAVETFADGMAPQ
jgi:hypothetical protein